MGSPAAASTSSRMDSGKCPSTMRLAIARTNAGSRDNAARKAGGNPPCTWCNRSSVSVGVAPGGRESMSAGPSSCQRPSVFRCQKGLWRVWLDPSGPNSSSNSLRCGSATFQSTIAVSPLMIRESAKSTSSGLCTARRSPRCHTRMRSNALMISSRVMASIVPCRAESSALHRVDPRYLLRNEGSGECASGGPFAPLPGRH